MNRHRTTTLRKLSIYGFDLVAGGHNLYALLEFDITNLRSRLREQRKNGEGGSLFAFILKAIGKCLEEFPEFNSMINLRNTTTFEEVDVSVPVEVERSGRLVTKQYVVRDVNRKTTREITEEIEEAKKNDDDEEGYVFSKIGQAILGILPRRVVLWFLRSLVKNHKRVKDLSGTLFVTSVTMFSNAPGFIIPYIGGPKAVSFAVGSSVKKPVAIGDEVKIREMINVTVVFNHDIIDGAPAARFINRFRRYLERDSHEIE